MPDICMCQALRVERNERVICPMAEGCHRYNATPTPGRQSYFAVAPFRYGIGRAECDYYWPATPSPYVETKR